EDAVYSSSVVNARIHLRSAVACLVVGCLLLLQHTGLTYPWAYAMLAPAMPLGLGLRAIDRGAYGQALWCAWLGAAGCGVVSALWGIASGPGLLALTGLLFSAMASAQLWRLAQRDR